MPHGSPAQENYARSRPLKTPNTDPLLQRSLPVRRGTPDRKPDWHQLEGPISRRSRTYFFFFAAFFFAGAFLAAFFFAAMISLLSCTWDHDRRIPG